MTDKTCFVIAPIGEVDSEPRKRSDLVLKYVIEPAATSCGYVSLRADKLSKPGMITSQIIQHILDDPLVIADLTDSNPNVFYELAIRHACRKPLVQLIKYGQQIPFDVAGTSTIFLDHKDLDSVANAISKITEQIKALETDLSVLENPISVSLDLQSLKQSGNPLESSLADVHSGISELRSSISGIEKKLEDPQSTIMRRLEVVLNRRDVRFAKSRAVKDEIYAMLRTLMTSIANDEKYLTSNEALNMLKLIADRAGMLGEGEF